MILSLQRPLVTLMREMASTANSSQVNITELQEKMQCAIEHTVKAAQQVRLFISFDVLKSLAVFDSVYICVTVWQKGRVETCLICTHAAEKTNHTLFYTTAL